jgi:5'-nucleotidase
VFGNLVAERAAGPGFATAYPCLDGPPVDNNGNHTKSDLNYNGSTPGAVSNRLVTPADTNGDICFYTSTATALIIDINAIADNTITTITNQRTDTRTTNRLVAADTVLKVRVPQAAGAKTVFGNLVAERTAGPGFATAYPCLDGPPVDNNGNHTKSDLNYDGSTPGAVSNRLVTPADTNGDICFYTSTATALIIDINAIADNTITTITNQRTDTRTIEFS